MGQIATFGYGLEESVIWRRERLPTIRVQGTIAEFPAVKAGQYRFAMDRRNIAVDRIPAANAPLDVTVVGRSARAAELM